MSLSGDMSCVGVDRSRTITVFLLLSQTYVLGNVRSELFFVYGCGLFIFLCCFCFFTADIYTYVFYLISKGIFHLGGLASKMHISVYMLFTEWKCFCFFSFIEYNLGIKNIQCIL